MIRIRNRFSSLDAARHASGAVRLLAACVLVAGLSTALADPTAVKNVDEPGRVPYEASIQFTKSMCTQNCTKFLAYDAGAGGHYTFDGPAIPAGKRLVLQWVTALLPTASAPAIIALTNSPGEGIYRSKWSFFGPFYGWPPNQIGMSSAAFATIEPGQSPHVEVYFKAAPTANFSYVTLSGYLIDATN
jgi:hypothetical protein